MRNNPILIGANAVAAGKLGTVLAARLQIICSVPCDTKEKKLFSANCANNPSAVVIEKCSEAWHLLCGTCLFSEIICGSQGVLYHELRLADSGM